MAVAFSSSSSSAHLQLVAAALTSLIPGSKVITKDDPLYKTLKDPQPLTYQVMSQNVIIETRPEPDPTIVVPLERTMDIELQPLAHDTSDEPTTGEGTSSNMVITVQFLNGQFYKYSVDPRATVYALKWGIFKSKGFDEYTQYDVNNIVLTFGRKELNDDDQLLTDCGIKDGSIIQCAVKLRGGAGPNTFVLEEDLLDPVWDFDFTHINDTGREFKRGGHVYKRPCGWKRIALKVRGQYKDDRWLGCSGLSGEWPVSYHGTSTEGVKGIAKVGYDIDKSKRAAFGKGHYSTPDIAVAARYATSFPCGGKWYKALMQNRVNLECTNIHLHGSYYVTPLRDNLRAYGICIREEK